MKKLLILALVLMTGLAHAEPIATPTSIVANVSVSAVPEPVTTTPTVTKIDGWGWTWIGFWSIVAIVATSIAISSPHQPTN